MIFDEVDRGVGGAVASAIGERLARLAEQSQVLVVTHSPQVAARASHHYRIEKATAPTARGPPCASSTRPNGARRSRACFPERRSPRRRGRRRRGCSTRHDGYVALLRGVNVGERQLKMADLRRIATELGLESAETYIASGNLLFRQRQDRTRS